MIYIESLLPNPVGQDAGNEWIRIANDGGSTESVYGWRVEDSGGAVFHLDGLGILQPNENVELKQTKISLNNSGDTIFLYDTNGTEVDRLGYGESVAEGEIIFSGKSFTGQPTAEQAPLANVLESGVLNHNSLGSNTFELFLLGFLVAAISTAAFVYVWQNVLGEHE